jgi:hypothetical protein
MILLYIEYLDIFEYISMNKIKLSNILMVSLNDLKFIIIIIDTIFIIECKKRLNKY